MWLNRSMHASVEQLQIQSSPRTVHRTVQKSWLLFFWLSDEESGFANVSVEAGIKRTS